jgi:hypothetical protein
MSKLIKDNWFKVAIITIVIGFGLYFATSSQKREARLEAVENLNNDLALQTRCADRAAIFYNQGGYEGDPEVFLHSYDNHWNKKLGKCFIQIRSVSLTDDYLMIGVYDAFERKTYADYTGRRICNVAITKDPEKCRLNSGKIWFDGNYTRNPADYQVGFQGSAYGPGVGDEHTEKQFLEHIQPLMTE